MENFAMHLCYYLLSCRFWPLKFLRNGDPKQSFRLVLYMNLKVEFFEICLIVQERLSECTVKLPKPIYFEKWSNFKNKKSKWNFFSPILGFLYTFIPKGIQILFMLFNFDFFFFNVILTVGKGWN